MAQILKIIFLTSIFCSVGFAKEMPQRLGVGIKDNISRTLPSLAVIYHLDRNSALTGGFGLDTEKDNSSMQFNAGVRYVIFQEKNLHFYSGGQIGYLNYEQATVKNSGLEFNLVGGLEFFLEGLENLGWSIEGGFGVSTAKDTRVRTIADNPFKAGMIFYF
jgi:hypothetical protein